MTEPVEVATNELQCPTCGYSLLGLPENRCPECGNEFDPQYVDDADFRSNLLPWERPETGSVLRRLFRTVVQASFRPGRFYSSASRRRARRIERPYRLIAAFALMSFCFFLVSALLGDAVFFLRLVIKGATSSQALTTLGRLNSLTWSFELEVCGLQVFSVLLGTMLTAILIKWRLGRRMAPFRRIDIVAFLSPAVPMGGFVTAVALVAASVSYGTFSILYFVAIGGQAAVVLLLLWNCCRRLLLLNRKCSVGMLLAGGILWFGAIIVVEAPYRLIALWGVA